MATHVARPLARLVLTTIVSSALALGSLACGDANTGRGLSGVGSSDDLGGGDGTSGGGEGSGSSNGATGGGSTGGGGGSTGGGETGGGGGNTGGGGTTAKPSFLISADKTAIDSELQMLTDLTVTLTPKDGFTGAVTLAMTGLPTGATGVFTPASVNVTGTAPVTATLRITTPSTVTPTTAPMPIKITGSGGTTPVTGEAALTYNVKRQITIAIPQNVAQSTNPFGAGDIVINTGGAISGANPIKVFFINKDSSKDHIIHSTNTTNGFFHGNTGNSIPLNGLDPVRNVSGTGRYPFYMHDGANTPAGAIKIN